MNIEYLREFIEIGLTLNLSKVARKLHVSQPSLSKHISALEAECQTELLTRSPSHIQLTAAGKALFEDAYDLVRRHDQTIERIRSFKNIELIGVGGLYDNGRTIGLINQALSIVNVDRPSLSVSYQNQQHSPLLGLLDQGMIDLAVTILTDSDLADKDYGRLFLMKDPMVCLAALDHPLAKNDVISINDLDGQMILQPVGSYSSEHGRSTVKKIMDHYGITPIEKPVFVHTITELTTVPNTDNLLIMEQSMLETQPLADNYKILRFQEEDVAFSFYAVWNKARETQALRQFITALEQAVSSEES